MRAVNDEADGLRVALGLSPEWLPELAETVRYAACAGFHPVRHVAHTPVIPRGASSPAMDADLTE